ncbi:apolipoprotein N-acyltransferase [Persephonella sp.]
MKNVSTAIFSGFLIALSFPDYFLPFLYIAGFLFYFKSLEKNPFKKHLLFSLITGLTFSGFSFYWIVFALTYYGDVSIPAGIGLFVLFAVAFSFIQFVSFSIILHFLRKRYGSFWLIFAPFIWIFLEILREFFPFGGFPWNLLGYTLSYINPVAQIASITGIYGLSLFAITGAVITYYFYAHRDFRSLRALFSYIVIFVLIFIVGSIRINNFSPEGEKKKIAIIQGNIPQEEKTGNNKVDILDKYIHLIKEAAAKNPDLIVLSESALPFYPLYPMHYGYKDYFFKSIANIKTPMLIGLDNVFYKGEELYLYNSLFLFDEKYNIVNFYNKIKLVPFGEYVPYPFKIFSDLFPYLEGYDFISGNEKTPLVYKDFRIIPLICFEAIFPYFVADFTKKGNIIVNVTNDAWFGKSPAPFQHFEMARIRAIENGRYLIRSANSGISAIINPVGEIKASLSLFEDGYIIGDVYLTDYGTIWENFNLLIYLFYFSVFGIIIFTIEIQKRKNYGDQRKHYTGNY